MTNRCGEVSSFFIKGYLHNICFGAWKSKLYQNAFYLSLNTMTTSLLGFVFWNLMTHFFTPAQVGIGSSLVAASSLVALLANMGLGIGLIRFLPGANEKAERLINATFTLSGALCIIGALVYLTGIRLFSPPLGFVFESPWMASFFVIFTLAGSLSILTDNSLIAGRVSQYILIKNFMISILKIPLAIIAFKSQYGYGIFTATGTSLLIVTFLSWFTFLPKVYKGYTPRPAIEKDMTLKMLPYSFANYMANLLNQAPSYIYPLIVLYISGPEESAYFWIAWMMTMVLSIIPGSVSLSLFAEGSHNSNKIGHNGKRVLLLTILITIPAVGSILLLCNWLLGIFGPGYSEHGSAVVRLLSLAIIPQSVNNLFITVNQVKKRAKLIVVQTGAQATISIGLGYWMLEHWGLKGLGMAYTFAHLTIAAIVIWPLLKSLNEKPNRIIEVKERN
ncbi:MAG: hypothetical protein VR68_12080 [Peptococcaceae bacterium BRH_c4a]|nr:MAG: hypothetical protein VR68_12080 [Peptococcaceae bacterium BRH_c4a]